MAPGTLSPDEIRTFLIADVRGYTAFTQAHGDEAAARLAAAFAAKVREVTGEYGGTLLELRGDEALCVFSSPRQAIRSAVEFQKRCAAALRADPSLPLRVGIGIDAGEAVRVEGGYRGGALNLAARLCSLARGGEVLVSEGLVHLAHRVEGVEYVDRGRVQVKGLQRPVRYHQATFPLDLPPVEIADNRSRRLAFAAVTIAAVLVVVVGFAITQREAGSPARGTARIETPAASIVGIDAASGRREQVLKIPGSPGRVVASDGRLWVQDTSDGSVFRVTPGEPPRPVSELAKPADAIVAGYGSVWAVNGDGEVSQIDPQWNVAETAVRLRTVVSNVSGSGFAKLAVGEGAVWLASDSRLCRISPGGKALKCIADDLQVFESSALAIGGGRAWFSPGGGGAGGGGNGNSTQGTIKAVNLESGTHVDVNAFSPLALAYAADALWVASPPNWVLKIDPFTLNVVDKIQVGAYPTAFATSDGAVWVASDFTITRINPRTDTVVRTLRLSQIPVSLAVMGNLVWASIAPAS